jgi:anaerobic ribonucleoside-triphosphate reductase activating protein
MEVRIAGITKESVVDGPGIRMVIFAQGCPHQCEGCHNPQTHDPDQGLLMETDEILNMVAQARLIRGVTLSGGEPFLQAKPFSLLAKEIRLKNLDVVTYTGFTFEELLAISLKRPAVRALLANTDILVDGPYLAAERDLRLAFRGSRNQRLINVRRSLNEGRTILWEDIAAVSNWG